MRAVTVNAATYVKQDRTSVSITSKKTGWQKINGDYYFYNSKGRLICPYKGIAINILPICPLRFLYPTIRQTERCQIIFHVSL